MSEYDINHIEYITKEEKMDKLSLYEKHEHLCGTLGIYGTQSQVNLAVPMLDEIKVLEEQNKRYREALVMISDETECEQTEMYANSALVE